MKIFKSLWFIVPAIILALYTLLGFFLVPYFITDILPDKISEKTNLTGTIKNAKFNPFTYFLYINDGNFSTKDKKPFISVHEVNTSIKISRLLLKELKFENIILNEPKVHAIFNKKGEFNFLNIVHEDNNTKEEKTTKSSPWNFSVNLLDVKNGSFFFEDNRKNYKTKLEHLSYKVKNLSTKQNKLSLQKLALTSSSAKELSWNGSLSLNPIFSKGNIKIKDLKLHEVWNYSLGKDNFYPKEAFLDLDLNYDINYTKDFLNINLTSLQVLLNKIKLFYKKQNLSNIKNVTINSKNFSFVDKNKSKNMNLENLDFNAKNIKLNSSDLLKMNANLNNACFSNFTFKSDLNNTIASVKNSDFDHFNFVYNDNNLTFDGNFSYIALEKANYDKNLNINSLRINDIVLGNKNLANTPFFMKLDDIVLSNIHLLQDKNASFLVKINDILLQNILAQNKNFTTPFLNLDEVKISKNNFSDKNLSLENIDISGLKAHVELDKEKEINIIKGLKIGTEEQTQSAFSYLVKNIKLKNSSIDFTDNSLKNPFKETFKLENIDLTNLSNNALTPLTFTSLIASKNINSTIKGTLTQNPLNMSANFNIKNNNLTQFNPYIDEFAQLSLKKGLLESNGDFTIQNEDINLKGNLALKNIDLALTNGNTLSSFKDLEVRGVDFKKNKLKINTLVLNEPNTYLNIDKNGTMSVDYLLKNKKEEEKDKKDKFVLDINNFKVVEGNFVLSDLNVPKKTTTSLTKININAKTKNNNASIQTQALLNKKAFLEANANLDPNDIRKKSEMYLNIKGLDIKDLNSYVEKYLGYEVDKGTMNTTFIQEIKEGKLKGKIQSGLNSFYLGKSVESKDALNLPLDLALGILRDNQDNVNISIPISGNMNSPNFSYSSLVITAITNILTSVITAPFSLLGNILGIDGEQLKTVGFKPSQYKLDPSEVEKMKQYAKILTDKEELKLTVSGAYDKDVDFNENNKSKKINTDKLLKLANNRSLTVKKSLVKLGIDENRIIVNEAKSVKAYQGQWIQCDIGIVK